MDTARTSRLSFARQERQVPQDTIEALEEAAGLTRTPPANLATHLMEAVVHGEDMRRPLDIAGSYPDPALARALAHQLRTPVSFGEDASVPQAFG